MREAIFDISGMTCAMCVKHIERAVNKLPGIDKAEVNLLTAEMQVNYQAEEVTEEQIIAAVTKAGYGASPVSNKLLTEPVSLEDSQVTDEADESYGCKNSDSTLADCDDATKRLVNSSNEVAVNVDNRKYSTDIQAPVRRELREQSRKLVISGVALAAMFALTMLPMLGLHVLPDFFSYEHNPLFNAYCQLLLSIVFLFLYKKNLAAGLRALWQKMPNMETLVAIGSLAALIYSLVQLGTALNFAAAAHTPDLEHLVHKVHDLYFESFATILFVVNLGKVIELYTQSKTGSALSTLESLRPKTAKVKQGQLWVEIAASAIKIGDRLLLEPYATVAVDGEVVSGQSFLDESSLSGETLPVFKETGDSLRQGAINGETALEYVALHEAGQSSLQKMIDLVYQTLASKASITKLVDKLSLYFVPTVIVLALLTLFVWLLTGAALSFALNRFMAVLLISCPCALGLAAPLAVMLTSGKAARSGILFKSAAVLEKLAGVDYLCFDKTGTLTENTLKVVEYYQVKKTENADFVKHLTAQIEMHSKHPVATTLINEFKQDNMPALALTEVKEIKAHGMEAVYNGVRYYLGKPQWLLEVGIAPEVLQAALEQGDYREALTTVLANDREILAVCRMFDVPKQEADEVLRNLHNLKLKTAVLSGDNGAHVAKLASELSLSTYKGDLLPADKLENIKRLQAEHKVMMVGDGINDLAAMAQADVAMALLSSTDLTNEAADVVVMQGSLWSVYNAVRLSRLCLNKIKSNLFWALIYNCICIPLAAGVLPYNLSPMWAALAMGLSSTFVVLNSLLINLFKTKH